MLICFDKYESPTHLYGDDGGGGGDGNDNWRILSRLRYK